uniref:Amino acid transporter n=1 Tax=Trypanosoma vivax (strain Y486) TaxID=1055687 RepID=G0TZY2_TRYVY|nr:amino acid transporter [Trypanosoma vivax Y486]
MADTHKEDVNGPLYSPNDARDPVERRASATQPDAHAEKSKDGEQRGGVLARVSAFLAIILPPGSIAASAFNVASTTIGAGIFGLPSAANSSGLVMAMIYLICFYVSTIFSIYCLALAADRAGVHSYEGVARALLGRKGQYTVAVIRAIFGFSACVAYVITVGDIFSASVKNSDASDFLKRPAGRRLITFILWACLMLPLVIPRRIDSLRHVSTFAVVFMVYVVGIVVVHSCTNGLSENVKDVSVGRSDEAAIVLFNSGNKAIGGLGVFIFSFLCQITSLEVYADMKDRTLTRFMVATAVGLFLCYILYAATALFGYLDFGSAVTGSVLLMYDPVAEPAVMVGYVGVFIKLCASYALLFMSFRNAIYNAVGWDSDRVVFWKHCLFVLSLSTVVLLCGLFIPKINTVFGFAGSICGGSLGFIFPALFLMYAGQFTWTKVGPLLYIVTYFLLICGVCAVVFGTGATILDAVSG